MPDGRTIPAISNASVGAITFKVLIEGTEAPPTFEFLSILTHKEVNRVPLARIYLRDGNAAEETFELSEGPDLVPGKAIEIQAGYDSNDQTIFKGIIVKHGIKIGASGDSMLCIDCRDESVKMTVGRKNKYFIDSKDSDAIEEILGTYGLTADVESTSTTHKQLVQYYTTDWDFMISRAQMNGLLVHASDGEIKINKPDFAQSATLALAYGGTLHEFEAEMDARNQYDNVECAAWSPKDQNLLTAEEAVAAKNKQGNLKESDLAQVIGLAKLELRHSGRLADTELKSWAGAQQTWSQLGKIVGRAKINGTYDVAIGNVITLNGLGDRFNGAAYVTAVRQELIEGEWYTHLQFGLTPEWFYQRHELPERPASGLLPGINGLQIGVVKQLEGDPESEERILVNLPLVEAAGEGIWARWASLDAGENRGWVFRPEIGDEVIVGFINDDPRDAVVLGMLHSSAKPAPIPASDDNFERGLTTKSEIKIHIDDDKKVFTIQTPGENKIVLDNDTGGIFLEDQNGNKITMDSNGITLESAKDIVLKATTNVSVEGVNVEQKASAQFKAEGSAGAELKSSAVAVVKGSLVQIN